MKIQSFIADIFNPYFHKYSKYKPSNTSICENYIKPVGNLEIIHRNVQISREKGYLYTFIGCLLVRVIRSTLISAQLDHPVSQVTDHIKLYASHLKLHIFHFTLHVHHLTLHIYQLTQNVYHITQHVYDLTQHVYHLTLNVYHPTLHFYHTTLHVYYLKLHVHHITLQVYDLTLNVNHIKLHVYHTNLHVYHLKPHVHHLTLQFLSPHTMFNTSHCMFVTWQFMLSTSYWKTLKGFILPILPLSNAACVSIPSKVCSPVHSIILFSSNPQHYSASLFHPDFSTLLLLSIINPTHVMFPSNPN